MLGHRKVEFFELGGLLPLLSPFIRRVSSLKQFSVEGPGLKGASIVDFSENFVLGGDHFFVELATLARQQGWVARHSQLRLALLARVCYFETLVFSQLVEDLLYLHFERNELVAVFGLLPLTR